MRCILYVLLLSVCWSPIGFASLHFLTISDIHYGRDNRAKDGQDTGPEVLKETLKQFNKLSNQADFIINLGDIPTHLLFDMSTKGEDERVVFHGLYKADTSKKPMFYIPGNNDSLSGNYQPFRFNNKSPLNFAIDWSGSCAFCDGLIVDDTHMRSGGYYSSYVIPGNKDILLIALNTIPWSKRNILLPKYPNQEADAAEEFIWLEQQLRSHSAKQLLIAMHIPPGKNYKNSLFWHEPYLNQFIALLEKNHHAYGEITLLSGHTHMDELRVLRLKNGLNIYDYSTPAISRVHYNNPGMKLFSLNKNSAINNYVTYYTTSFTHWGNAHYQAVGSSKAIFPGCQKKTLSDCLNSLSTKQVCSALEDKFFYGAKSPRIALDVCKFTYIILKNG